MSAAPKAQTPPGASPAAPTGAPSTAARFAWPAAFVAIAAMGFGYLHTPAVPTPPPALTERPGPVVVQELRALGRLETAAIHVEKVVDVSEHQSRIFGLVDADDALLYVASGEVVLGIDLGKLRPEDARFDAATKTAYVELPEPEVFSSRLDEAGSHVHTRHTAVLARRNEQLEAIARQRALAAFASAGNEARAHELARAQAERQLGTLAKAWGAHALVVTWRDAAHAELPIR